MRVNDFTIFSGRDTRLWFKTKSGQHFNLSFLTDEFEYWYVTLRIPHTMFKELYCETFKTQVHISRSIGEALEDFAYGLEENCRDAIKYSDFNCPIFGEVVRTITDMWRLF